MTYSTQQDMIDRFTEAEMLQLTDRDGDDVIDAEVLNRALEDARDVIDGYLAKRFKLPLSAIPNILKGISCNIARYMLYTDDAHDQVKDRYNNSLKLLKQISQGEIEIGVNGIEPDSDGDNVPQSTGSKATFTMSSLEGM